MAADSLAMESQHRALKAVLEASQATCARHEEHIAQLKGTIATQANTIEQAEQKAHADEAIRFGIIIGNYFKF
jgi:predicted GTPase